MSDHDVAIAILAAVYTVVAARVAIVMRRQSDRMGRSGLAEFFLASVWPVTMVFVGITVLLFDAQTPGFEKASTLTQAQDKAAT